MSVVSFLSHHRLRLCWAIGFLIIGWSLWQTIFTTGSPMSAYGNLGDEAVMVQAAERIYHGQVPHRDFYSYPPGTAYYPLAGWFYVFGDRYIVVRMFSFATALGICLSLWWIAHRLTSWGSTLPPLIFSLLIFPFWPFVSYHWTFLLLALISTGFLTGPPTRKRWLSAGISMGLCFLILPNKALALFAAQVLSMIFFRRQLDFRSSAKRYFFGLGGVAVLTALVLTAIHGWPTVWQSVVINNLRYYPQTSKTAHNLTGLLMQLMAMLIISFSLPLFFRVIKPDQRPTYILVGLSHIALLCSTLYFFEHVHVLQIFGFGVILFVWTYWLLIKKLCITFDAKSWVVFRCALATLCFVYIISTLEIGTFYRFAIFNDVFVSKNRQIAYHTQKGTIYNNPTWRSSITKELPIMDDILSTGLRGQQIFILPFAPGYYYFYGFNNPTAYDILLSDNLPPGELDRLKTTLNHTVDVVVYLPYSWGLSPDSDIMQWIQQVYPNRLETLDGEIVLFGKKPFSTSLTQFMQEHHS